MRRPLILLAAALVGPAEARAQTPYPECNKGLIPTSVQNINLCNAAVDFLLSGKTPAPTPIPTVPPTAIP